jgi:gamma-glutamyltranspeptidase/glutathione hydrolase
MNGRAAVFGREVVATSQPLAAQAGLDTLARGGSAVDAAIAAAAALVVVEPTGCGLGSDLFAMVSAGDDVVGLNASGRSPAAWEDGRFAREVPQEGPHTVTVPGAVSGWAALHERFGRVPFRVLLEPAIGLAREGFPASPGVAAAWARGVARHRRPEFLEMFAPGGEAPAAGARFASEALARSLERIGESRGQAMYAGELGEKLARYVQREGGALSTDDLVAHRVTWEVPLEVGFRGRRILEMPPNGQGLAALTALGVVDVLEDARLDLDTARGVHLAAEAMKIGILDVERHVADPAHMELAPESLLHPEVLAQHARSIDDERAYPADLAAPKGGTVLVVAGDRSGRMCALIQSNYMGFGSGLVVPETGISLQNRGAGFAPGGAHPNRAGPAKRPLHTILPAMVCDDDGPVAAFGVMGGAMQPQGHLQLMVRWLDEGKDPQAAIEAPRFRVMGGGAVALEPGTSAEVLEGLKVRGHEARMAPEVFFGGAQMIAKTPGGFVAGSDPRRDGHGVGR